MDGHLEPPSPAPSPETLGLGQVVGHNATASFSGSGPLTKKAIATIPQSLTPYVPSHANHIVGDLRSTTPVYQPPIEGAHLQLGPYSTPETSPPRASQTRTRSTTRLPRPSELDSIYSKGNRVTKPTPKRKRERAKSIKRPSRVVNPLSELATHYPDVAVADIASYVNRPREVRLKEVAQSKTPGKVKRPMNAFMLYRKAYQILAKELCTQNNHQVVSQVCGDGWPLEPESVREQFNQWARIERENHHIAHPNYKFTPSKPARKPKRPGNGSEDGSALADPDWEPRNGSRVNGNKEHSRHGQHTSGIGGTPVSIFESYNAYGSPNPGLSPAPPSMYQYSTLEKPSPAPYDNTCFAGAHYHQQHIHQPIAARCGLVGDVLIRETHSPAAYGGELNEFHGRPSQYPPIGRHVASEQVIDPSLVAGPEGVRYDAFPSEFELEAGSQWQGQEDMPDTAVPGLQDSMAPLDNILARDPQLGYLRGDEDSWQIEEIGGQQHQFDTWPA